MIDDAHLNFDQGNVWILNFCLALIMFGVALELKGEHFSNVFRNPRASVVGLVSQFILLPLMTFLLVSVLRPAPSLALGMILVAACPGGNISNFLTHMAGGNSALSVSLTAMGTVLAILLTPINFELWGSLYGPTASILKAVSVNPLEIFKAIVLLAGIPIVLGMLVNRYLPEVARRISVFVKPGSILLFSGIIVIAFMKNYDVFTEHIDKVLFLVFIHNLVALGTGFLSARLARLPEEDQKTIAIETGIQNSGLGLLLIFTFFDGLGGMAIVAAWWGIWHIISGVGIAFFLSKVPLTFGRKIDA
jgi:BASS family bile acid:Na+ symporter